VYTRKHDEDRRNKKTTQTTKYMSSTDPTKNTTQKTKYMSNRDPTAPKTKYMSNGSHQKHNTEN
jgi:hypothetical protein